MGTRAFIAIAEPAGYLSIYTHWDGYPEHHLPILTQHYSTAAKVRELLALGDLSVLGESLDACFAYARDRGDRDCEAKPRINITALRAAARKARAEFLYIFEGGVWLPPITL